MKDFYHFLINAVLLTLGVLVILALYSGIVFILGRFGVATFFVAFTVFVGWIAYGAWKKKK